MFLTASQALSGLAKEREGYNLTGGFITLDIGSRTASGRLWLRGQNAPTTGSLLQMGHSAMLMDTLIMRPELLQEELTPFLGQGNGLWVLTEAFRNARRSPHDLGKCWGLLDDRLREHGEVLASSAFLSGTTIGALLLLSYAFLLTGAGLMLEQVAEDGNLRDYLPTEMSILLCGRGALPLRRMEPQVRNALLQFVRLPMSAEHPTQETPLLFPEAGTEAAMGLLAMRDPEQETRVVGKRSFSGRVNLAPNQLLAMFLSAFRAVFPEQCERIFPGVFDEAGRLTPWADRMINNITAAHFAENDPVNMEALSVSLAELRQVYW